MSGINRMKFSELLEQAKGELENIETTVSLEDYDLSARIDMAVSATMDSFVYAKDVFEFMANNDDVMNEVQVDYGMLDKVTAVNVARLTISETLRDALIKEFEHGF